MGHETENDRKKLKELEIICSTENASPESLLELATILIEPFHQEDQAIALLESFLSKNPLNDWAKILLSYCHILYSMDSASLKKAVALLKEVLEKDNKLKGAATMLLAEALEDLNDLSISEKIRLLEISVNYEPNWVFNHQRLAGAYKQANMFSEAIMEMEIAINSIVEDTNYEPGFLDEFIAGKNFPKDILNRSLTEIKLKCNIK